MKKTILAMALMVISLAVQAETITLLSEIEVIPSPYHIICQKDMGGDKPWTYSYAPSFSASPEQVQQWAAEKTAEGEFTCISGYKRL